jgi:transposase-like protein
MTEQRWSPQRKLALLRLIDPDKSSDPAALLKRYGLSPAELAEWRRGYEAHGLAGLAVTKQRRRRPPIAS